MKLLTLFLYLARLVVCAEEPEWIAVLDRNHARHGLFEQHGGALKSLGANHHHTFELGSFRGYMFSSCEDTAKRVAEHREVAYIQANHVVSGYGMVKKETAEWNLEEISHRGHIGHEVPREYLFDDSAGNDTVVYVVDSGIDIQSEQFGGRAEWGMTLVNGALLPRHRVDEAGHGTHVAGIIGSRTYGVAKKTKLVAVKVLDQHLGGRSNDVVRALIWAHADAKRRGALGRAVVNLSLGGTMAAHETRTPIMDAVAEVTRQGMFVVTAAGNHQQDALRESPGAEPAACNVGAHDEFGKRAAWSNFGPGVDVWAPGVNIRSVRARRPEDLADPSGLSPPSGVREKDGTSLAAPHVAGVAAYLMGRHAHDAPPFVDWCAHIRKMGKRASVPGEPAPYLYNGGDDPAPAS